jgi:hypothetical protein
MAPGMLAGMAPGAPHSYPTNFCAICMNEPAITCAGCNNIRYCSVTCQQKDAAQHDILCGTFKDFQDRPSAKHFRAIYFPADDPKPRFILLLMDKTSGYLKPNLDDLTQYVPGSPSGEKAYFSIHCNMQYEDGEHRWLKKGLRIQYDPESTAEPGDHDPPPSTEHPPNFCFATMIDSRSSLLRRGGQVGHVDYNSGEEEGAGDVDTTSLSAFLAWVENVTLY